MKLDRKLSVIFKIACGSVSAARALHDIYMPAPGRAMMHPSMSGGKGQGSWLHQNPGQP